MINIFIILIVLNSKGNSKENSNVLCDLTYKVNGGKKMSKNYDHTLEYVISDLPTKTKVIIKIGDLTYKKRVYELFNNEDNKNLLSLYVESFYRTQDNCLVCIIKRR